MTAASAVIPEFDATQLDTVQRLLDARYRQPVDMECVEVELALSPEARRPTACPALYWRQRGAHFVVCRVAEQGYRGQFFYVESEQFGTGRDTYDDLGDCVAELLRVQSDHERERAGVRSGANAVDLSNLDDGEDYHPPLII